MSIIIDDNELEQLEQEDMASLEHGAIGTTLISYLFNHVRPNKLGRVFDAQTTFRFVGKKSNRQPDVSFVSSARLPKNFRADADFAPDLAVEIVSKNDKIFENDSKILQYQRSGVKLVWIIDPITKAVDVYRLKTGLKSERLIGDDELSGEDVIPGFKLKVNSLFEDIAVEDEDLDEVLE